MEAYFNSARICPDVKNVFTSFLEASLHDNVRLAYQKYIGEKALNDDADTFIGFLQISMNAPTRNQEVGLVLGEKKFLNKQKKCKKCLMDKHPDECQILIYCNFCESPSQTDHNQLIHQDGSHEQGMGRVMITSGQLVGDKEVSTSK